MRWMTAVMLIVAACGGDDGGNCPPYMTIVGGTFARTGAMTTWTMEVEDLPATLTFDKEDVPANVLEYEWSIEIDPDSDGDTDLRASMLHYRSGSASEMELPVLGGTQQDLWTIMGNTGSLSGDVDVTIAGNVITYVVDDGEDPLLPMVTSEAQATWITFAQLGGSLANQCQDSYKP